LFLLLFGVIQLLDPPALLLVRSIVRVILMRCLPHRLFCRAVR